MTDERLGDLLWAAIAALPTGSGIVLRHYATPRQERAELARQIAEHCQRHGLTLAVARDPELARQIGSKLVHNPPGDTGGLAFSSSAHSLAEAKKACLAGAALLFVSPVFPTRSHPGRPGLGSARAVRIAQTCPIPAIALGGVNRGNFTPLQRRGFYGWAGIDAWLDEIRT